MPPPRGRCPHLDQSRLLSAHSTLTLQALPPHTAPPSEPPLKQEVGPDLGAGCPGSARLRSPPPTLRALCLPEALPPPRPGPSSPLPRQQRPPRGPQLPPWPPIPSPPNNQRDDPNTHTHGNGPTATLLGVSPRDTKAHVHLTASPCKSAGVGLIAASRRLVVFDGTWSHKPRSMHTHTAGPWSAAGKRDGVWKHTRPGWLSREPEGAKKARPERWHPVRSHG